jgi:CubicO group peptidase (beta-lactamase class C family)
MDASGVTLNENVRRIATVPLLYAPGTAWCYSLAIDVLGAVIEQVQGQPLDVAIKTLVTGPLAMHNTAFALAPQQEVATAYVNDQPEPHRLQEGSLQPLLRTLWVSATARHGSTTARRTRRAGREWSAPWAI